MATPIQQPGLDTGKGVSSTDTVGLFLKVFAGESLAAFERMAKAKPCFVSRSISSGKSATFPVTGRHGARYLKAGESLDTGRGVIKNTERVIVIDGLLTSDVMIFDLDDAMAHYDIRSVYSTQVGEALAISMDGAILAELAKAANSSLDAATNENIAGLGSATILAPINKADAAASANAVGRRVLEGLAEARGKMTKNYVPASDRFAFVTPDTYSAILASQQASNANFSELVDQETGNIRNVCGFTVIEVPHLTAGGAPKAGAVDETAANHAFPTTTSTPAKPAVNATNVLALCAHRESVATVVLKDLNIERARRPEYQADQIIGKMSVGHGMLRPESVVALVIEDAV